MEIKYCLIGFLIFGMLCSIAVVATGNITGGIVIEKMALAGSGENSSSAAASPGQTPLMTPAIQTGWSSWVNLGNAGPGTYAYYPYAAPSVVAKQQNRLDVFSADYANSKLMQLSWDGSTWGTWNQASNTSGYLSNPTAAISRGAGAIDVFSSESNRLIQAHWSSISGWGNWQYPDGKYFLIKDGTGPAGVATSASEEFVFWLDPTGHLRYMNWDGSQWLYSDSDYGGFDLDAPSGITLMNNSVAVVANPDRNSPTGHDTLVRVFARGSDNQIWTISMVDWTGWRWGSWTSLSGCSPVLGAPSAVTRYNGCIDLVYRTLDGKTVLREWNQIISGWTDETVLNTNPLNSDPSIASWDEARLDVFVQTPGRTVWQTFWNSPKPNIISFGNSAGRSTLVAGGGDEEIFLYGENFYPDSIVSLVSTVTPHNFKTTFYGISRLGVLIPASYRAVPTNLPLKVVVPGTTQSDFYSNVINLAVVNPFSKMCVFRPSTHTFYLDYNGNGRWDGPIVDRQYNFGLTGDIPVSGDWNNNGKTEIGVFRPSLHTFYLDYNGNGKWEGTTTDRQHDFGLTGDIPICGDWNHDGTSEIGVFRPLTHTFYGDFNGNGVWNGPLTDGQANFGLMGDIPVVGDWNKDGYTEIGVFRPSTHTFYLDFNGNHAWNGAAIDRQANFGLTGDIPISGELNNDGFYEIGVYRPLLHTFYLDYDRSGGWSGSAIDRQYNFGLTGDQPISGNW